MTRKAGGQNTRWKRLRTEEYQHDTDMKSLNGARVGLFSLAVALLIAGCSTADKDAAKRIVAFSQAVALTTQNTSDAFDTLERRHFDLEIARVVAEGGWQQLNADRIKPFLDPGDAQARLLVLQGLQAYAEKLSAIMGNEPLDAYDKATKDLSDSLQNVNEEFVKTKLWSATPVDSQQIQIAAAALNAMGRWIIEAKRQKAVKASIEEMHPHITNIVTLLSRDFVVLRRNLHKTYDEGIQAQKLFVQHSQDKMDALTQRSEIKGIADLIIEQNKADRAMQSMEKAVEGLGATHAELSSAFNRSSARLEQLLSDLIAEGKRVKKFYDSLETKEK